MSRRIANSALAAGVVLAAAIVVAAVSGCQAPGGGGSAALSGTQAGGGDPSPAVGGAQIWAQNCGRCHNLRSPSEFNSAQWAVIVHHMRLRAPLTGQDQRAILQFLQTSN